MDDFHHANANPTNNGHHLYEENAKLPSMSQIITHVDDTHLDIEYFFTDASTSSPSSASVANGASSSSSASAINLLPIENENFTSVVQEATSTSTSQCYDFQIQEANKLQQPNYTNDLIQLQIPVVMAPTTSAPSGSSIVDTAIEQLTSALDLPHCKGGNQLSPTQHQDNGELNERTENESDDSLPDDEALLELSVKDLNRRLQGLPKAKVAAIKQKRRTLKNRGYAQNCRQKKQVQRHCLEGSLTKFEEEIASLKSALERAERERDEAMEHVEKLKTLLNPNS